MPYIIKKVTESGKKGYKVCKKDEPKRCFSKHALSEDVAKKQRTAIILSELGLSRKKGGASLPEKIPGTIAGIIDELNANGFDEHVFDLSKKKPAPKKKEWEELYKSCQKGEKAPGPEPIGRHVKGPEEAFKMLSLDSSSGKKSDKSKSKS